MDAQTRDAASEAGRMLARARHSTESKAQRAALTVIEHGAELSPALRRAVAAAVAEPEEDPGE